MEEVKQFEDPRECPHCHGTFEAHDMTETTNNLVCPDCLTTYYEECEDCGEYYRTNDMTDTREGRVCPDCLGDKYAQCGDCWEWLLRDELTHTATGHYFCNDCADDYIFCENCEEWHHINNCTECDDCGEWFCDGCILSDGHSNYLCRSCRGNYVECENCGRFVYSDYYIYDDATDSSCCSDCYNRNHRGIHDYNYKPDPEFYGQGPRYYGYELETDKGNGANALAREITENFPEVYCKHDGSLDDGVEIVSHPCSYDYHRNNLDMAGIMATCTRHGFKSHDAGTCGLHVHISRVAFGNGWVQQDGNIAKLLFLFEKHWTQILRFSRRTKEQADHWAARYCGTGEPIDAPADLLDKATGSGRYHAVNLENDDTVELRIFRGTLNLNTFYATLQLCETLMDIVTELDTQEIQALTWSQIVERGAKYPELTKYLKTRNLDDFLTLIPQSTDNRINLLEAAGL